MEAPFLKDVNQTLEESIIKHPENNNSINKERSRLDDNSHDFGNEHKVHLREMSRFSSTRDTKSKSIADRPKTSPMKVGNMSRDDGHNHSRFHGGNVSNGQEQEVDHGLLLLNQIAGEDVKKKENKSVEKGGHKKKVVNEDYGISALDDTFEIVRKTNVAVRTLSKRNEQVKREMKNFEEQYRERQKENESAPTNSIKAVSLTRDFVFNEKEFEKIIEHEEMLEEREKAQKEYAERIKLKDKKKRVLSPKPQVESKVKSFHATATSKFGNFFTPKEGPKIENVFITREERKEINKSVQDMMTQKEEELKRKQNLQYQIHQKYGIFSSDNNLFRIQSHNYIKLLKEKEKVQHHMIRDLKTAKYKKREHLQSNLLRASVQSNRLRSVQSNRDLPYGLEPLKVESSLEAMSREEIKSPFLHRVREVLTKPIKDTDANKLPDYNTHVKRLESLKKKSAMTVEHVNKTSYMSL